MKIHISHELEEKKDAGAVFAALVRKYPDARIHESEDKTGKYHLYLTTRKPKNP